MDVMPPRAAALVFGLLAACGCTAKREIADVAGKVNPTIEQLAPFDAALDETKNTNPYVGGAADPWAQDVRAKCAEAAPIVAKLDLGDGAVLSYHDEDVRSVVRQLHQVADAWRRTTTDSCARSRKPDALATELQSCATYCQLGWGELKRDLSYAHRYAAKLGGALRTIGEPETQ